jgi:hypothetical protein
MAITYPLVKYGASLYATSTGLVGGTRYICTIEGLNLLTEKVGGISALDLTRYPQYQTAKPLVSITYPLMDTAMFDSIRDVVQAAITGSTTFAWDITCDLGTFTFTATPAEDAVTAEQSILSGYVADFTVRAYCVD